MDAHNQLVAQAAKLTALGLEIERERKKLARLGKKGVSYESREMREAYERFQSAEAEWKRLEAEHLALRGAVEKEMTERGIRK